MVKKFIIEKDDEPKILGWDEERLGAFREKYTALDIDEAEYVISVDIADKDSEDQSVMCYFKIVDGKRVFERCEEI